MKKRILSAVLAMSMVFGMTSVTAFAEGEEATTELAALAGLSSGQAFSAENEEIKMPTISVTVPTTGTIVIDPFNTAQGGQIDSTEQTIINNSNIPLSVTFKGSTATGSTGVSIVAKAPTDGSKWAVVNLAITDGLNKATTKVLSATAQDISVATPIAPKGGIVKFKYNGTCATSITKEGATAWNGESDTITAATTFVFTPQAYTTYTAAKTLVINNLPTVAVDVAKGASIDEVLPLLPKTAIGDGKEFPITWACETYDGNTAAEYTFTVATVDADIYNIAVTTPPTIKVKVVAE